MKKYFVVASIIFGMLFFLMACNKKPEEEGNLTLDESTNEILLMQKTFNDDLTTFLVTMDTAKALFEVLQLFLAHPSVESGVAVEQGVIITYKNHHVGGIFLDPQDYPDEDKFIPHKSVMPEHSENNLFKAVPANRKTLFINPHYQIRKTFTDPLLENYDRDFPDIGYNKPERFFDEECTVEKFTLLEDYGYVHIYSHGLRVNDNMVYLITGEEVNEITHFDNQQMLLSGDIVYLFSRERETSVYFVTPGFVEAYNDFSDDLTLFYGGFSYSSLGGWPEMFVGAGAGGYFGFDWSAYTSRNASWAVDLVEHLANDIVNPSLTAGWWMMNSSISKQHWNTQANRYTNITYFGDEDLALWQHGGALPEFISFELSMNMNVVFEDSDSVTIEFNPWVLPFFHIGKLTKTGDIYTGKWDDETFMEDGVRTGSASVTLNTMNTKLANFYYADTIVFSGMTDWIEHIFVIEIEDLYFTEEEDGSYLFSAEGPDACTQLTTFTYEIYKFYMLEDNYWQKAVSFNCDGEENNLKVYLLE